MRCMLQSACEELIRKQQRPSYTSACVYVCMCVVEEPPWHGYDCLLTSGGIDLEGKADMNSDPQMDSIVRE